MISVDDKFSFEHRGEMPAEPQHVGTNHSLHCFYPGNFRINT